MNISKFYSWFLLLHISPALRKRLYLTLLIAISASFADFFSISLLIPFVNLLFSTNENLYSYSNTFPLLNSFYSNIDNSHYKLTIAMLFIVAAILSAALKLVNIKMIHQLIARLGIYLNSFLYNSILTEPYLPISNDVSYKTSLMTLDMDKTLLSVTLRLNLITSSISVIATFSALISINFLSTVTVIALFGAIYVSFQLCTRKRIIANSKNITDTNKNKISMISDTYKILPDIILNDNNSPEYKKFKNYETLLRFSQAKNKEFQQSPRYFVEFVLILTICILVIIKAIGSFDTQSVQSATIIALLVGAQKIIPQMQLIYGSIAGISSNSVSYNKVMAAFKKCINNSNSKFYQKKKKYSSTMVTRSVPKNLIKSDILCRSLTYSYDGLNFIFKNYNLTIKSKSLTTIIGPSGSGKTTLMEILLGLRPPISGKIIVDGVNIYESVANSIQWQKYVSYVPQDVEIYNGTILQNIIGFSVDHSRCDFNKIYQIIQICNLREVIDSFEFGLDTKLAEDGAKLSGGQKKRLGICRALYKDGGLIVCDEITAGMDSETANNVLSNLKNYGKEHNKTIINVSHRQIDLCYSDSVLKINQDS